jgi:putative ABC transport system permease protein
VEVLALVYRNLRARPVRSILTLLGIVVSTASMVLFLSFGEGLRKALGNELSRVGPAILVLPEGADPFGASFPELPPSTLEAVRQAAPQLGITQVIPSMVLTRGGLDPETSFVFQGIPREIDPTVLYPGLKVKEGSLRFSANGAVAGAKIAERSKLVLGRTLRLNAEVSVKVEGILEDSGGLADNVIFVPITAVSEVLSTENYSSLLVAIDPNRKAEDVANALKERIPGLNAQTTGDVLKFAERAVRISDLVRFGISLVALIVGGLLVANTVMMSVYERIREFGLMRALGARRGFIFGLVLLESLLLGVAGGLLGLVVGQLGSQIVNWYTNDAVGLDLSTVTLRLALFALGVAISLGLLAGFFPARTASRLKVVEAMGRI